MAQETVWTRLVFTFGVFCFLFRYNVAFPRSRGLSHHTSSCHMSTPLEFAQSPMSVMPHLSISTYFVLSVIHISTPAIFINLTSLATPSLTYSTFRDI
ncbi:hypothetical protein I79_013123 [Cricetulus griseus]|uniref:Uncharacterized protein n=1 Tax=Cricetulus griseus TaxID=10029 RepID=G3HQL8_CRIGR|nr:hypothetical protein I79_013123 [Cricetulus griseus]